MGGGPRRGRPSVGVALRRTASGQFKITQCLPLDEIEKLSLPEIEKRLIPTHEAAPRVAQ